MFVTSISASPSRSLVALPGTVQTVSATPIEPTPVDAARASAATSSSDAPAAAAAPATLWTKTVPATPRRPL